MPGNALKLEPWDTNGNKDDGFPQVPGAIGNSWESFGASRPNSSGRMQLIPGNNNSMGLCGLECDEPFVSPNRSPNLRQRMVLSNRDKESLLEEIIDLKRALSDQAYHLKLHKVHYSAVQLENRKLEKDVEDLEVSGNLEAPRTGGPTRLRAKLQGLRTRLGDLQATCDIQHDELCQLRRDIRVAHTRECEVERDVYAAEIGRLQKVVKRLKALQARITAENQELSRLRDKSARLKLANQRLQSCIVIAHRTLEVANKEVTSFRAKALECTTESRKYASKITELQDHAKALELVLDEERTKRQKVEKKIKLLAYQRKEWDRAWEEKQKKKALGEEAYQAQQAAKKAKKKKPKVVRKDRGAHATEYGDTSSSSSEGKPFKKTRQEEYEARKKETIQKYEQKKKDLMKVVQEASQAFIQQEHAHYDKVFANLGSPPSTSNITPKDQQKQHELETGLLHTIDETALDFIDHIEDIHFGSSIPKPNVQDLSPKAASEALVKYERDEAEDAAKRKAARAKGVGGGAKVGAGAAGSSGTQPGTPSSSDHHGRSDDHYSKKHGEQFGRDHGDGGKMGSRPGSPSSQSSHSSQTYGSSSDSSSANSVESEHDDFESKSEEIPIRKDRERGKNGKKMSSKDFEGHKSSFLKKVQESSKIFVEKEQTHYMSILADIESGAREPSSKGWFSISSCITEDDKQFEQAFQNSLHEDLEAAADQLLDHVEDAQYGTDKAKVPRLRLKELKAQESKQAQEREERMHAQKEVEEKARRKAEQEAAQRWKTGENKIEVMIDHAKLEEDEYAADVKEVKGRLSVEINLKRTTDHPYPGSPRALALEEEQKREEQQAREEQTAREARRMESILAGRQREEERARWEAEKLQILQEMEQHRGLTAAEDRRRQELEVKLASGIPLTSEEEAELKALHARMRGRSGLTIQEEIRFKELQAKLALGIPLTALEQAEFNALKARFRGKSGLTAAEESRLKELQAKIDAGIPLTEEEQAEMKLLKAKLRGPSGLTASERSRLKELQAKLASGVMLTDEEEAELRDLKLDVLRKCSLTGREEARMNELEAKLQDGIPLTVAEEAELNELRSRFRGKSGLTIGQESRLKELEEKLTSGIDLTAEEEEELKNLQGMVIGESGLTKKEEDRLKELEAKVMNGIPLTEAEEVEMKRLQKKLKAHNQLTQAEDVRRKELEAKLAQGLILTEEEEQELKELQAKRWNEWPLSKDEEQRRKELEAKLRSGIPLTEEETAELLALQLKLKGKRPMIEFGEVDMSRSEEMRLQGKLPFIDEEMQGFIKENIKGVLGHLENITEVIVQKQQKLAKHEGGALATVEAAADVLRVTEVSSGGSKPGTPRGHRGGEGGGSGHSSTPETTRGHKGGTKDGSRPSTPRDHGDGSGGSRPGTPRGEKHHGVHVEKGEHSRLGPQSRYEDHPSP